MTLKNVPKDYNIHKKLHKTFKILSFFFFSLRFSNEGCTRLIVMLNLILALKFQAFKSIKLCIFFLKIKDWDTFCFIHLRVE